MGEKLLWITFFVGSGEALLLGEILLSIGTKGAKSIGTSITVSKTRERPRIMYAGTIAGGAFGLYGIYLSKKGEQNENGNHQ